MSPFVPKAATAMCYTDTRTHAQWWSESLYDKIRVVLTIMQSRAKTAQKPGIRRANTDRVMHLSALRSGLMLLSLYAYS